MKTLSQGLQPVKFIESVLEVGRGARGPVFRKIETQLTDSCASRGGNQLRGADEIPSNDLCEVGGEESRTPEDKAGCQRGNLIAAIADRVCPGARAGEKSAGLSAPRPPRTPDRATPASKRLRPHRGAWRRRRPRRQGWAPQLLCEIVISNETASFPQPASSSSTGDVDLQLPRPASSTTAARTGANPLHGRAGRWQRRRRHSAERDGIGA
jgi:hypothetical protein